MQNGNSVLPPMKMRLLAPLESPENAHARINPRTRANARTRAQGDRRRSVYLHLLLVDHLGHCRR